jgi:hypothetical protein
MQALFFGSSGIPLGESCFLKSFRLVRNPSGDVFIQVPHKGICTPDKLKLALSAHVLYLFFLYDGSHAVLTYLVIYKLMQKILDGKASRIEVVLVFIDLSKKVISNTDVQRRSRVGHDIYCKETFHHAAIISERFRTSRNDIYTKTAELLNGRESVCDMNRKRETFFSMDILE